MEERIREILFDVTRRKLHPNSRRLDAWESDRIQPIPLALLSNRLLSGRKEWYLALVDPNAMKMDG